MPRKGEHCTEEVKAKISEVRILKGIAKGERNPFYGRHHSKEALLKISMAKKGIPNPKHSEAMRGRHPSLETKQKMSISHKGKHFSKEHRIRLSDSTKGERHYNWQGGLSYGPYCPKFNKEFKERVRAFWGYECGLCGKSQKMNGKKLHVHHVNYQKDACCNDEVARQFIPLCSSCHSKTGHDRENWERTLSKIIEKIHGRQCYFHKEEILTTWGI
jgi:hypothetical protein